MSAYLTFDFGTTACKTALIGEDGIPIAVHTEEYSFESPHPDWAQIPADTYWNAAKVGVRAVVGSAALLRKEIKAIGLSSQGQTFIPIERNGKPLREAIVWVDNRAEDIAREWEESLLNREEFRRITGYPWIPSILSVFKIAWLARNEPESLNAWKILCLPDYITFRMTGETATDPVTAQSTGMYDIRTRSWNLKLAEAAGLSRDQLPEVVSSSTPIGRLTKEAANELDINSEAVVCIGTNDQLAGALGAGNARPGIVSETTGTALAVVATTANLLDDPRVTVGPHAAEGLWFSLSFTITSAVVLKWFRDLCAPEQDYDEFLAGVENIPPGCEGVTMIPHFAGTATPTYNPSARGAFSGLALGHTRLHLARAIMEACACSLKECLEPIADSGTTIESVRSLGGAARSDVWLQIKADLLGLPVERPACSDAASLGAAVLAATGTGQFGSIAEASEAWYRREKVFEPDFSRHHIYADVYKRYLDLYRRLYG
ncbi:MAG: FGGY family carbohydrate kinase [Armatimonadota bacterium]|nr:FGGY family carbohydrate kinase [Armatimonadota bacterium]